MKKPQHISDILPKYLAWDMDTDTLDLKRDKDIIIPRALLATTPATFQMISAIWSRCILKIRL